MYYFLLNESYMVIRITWEILVQIGFLILTIEYGVRALVN